MKNPYYTLMIIISLVKISLQASLSYQANPYMEWIFDPSNEATFPASTYDYAKENKGTGVNLFFGKYNDIVNFKVPNRLWNGNIFEGEEINVAEPDPKFNMGTSFALAMWIYIMDINAIHTLFCK
jgi:hypothetical protein